MERDVPGSATGLVLPARVGACLRANCWNEELAIRSRESEMGDVLHGFRLLPLPADFLCWRCVNEFECLRVAELDIKDAREWCARMQCNSFGDDVSAMKMHLKTEQDRLERRTRALLLARRVDETAENQVFKSFLFLNLKCNGDSVFAERINETFDLVGYKIDVSFWYGDAPPLCPPPSTTS